MTVPDQVFDFTGYYVPIGPDWSFGVTIPYSGADGSSTFTFNGKLDASGSASGTLQVDMAVNTSSGVVHCSTGNVTWNAS